MTLCFAAAPGTAQASTQPKSESSRSDAREREIQDLKQQLRTILDRLEQLEQEEQADRAAIVPATQVAAPVSAIPTAVPAPATTTTDAAMNFFRTTTIGIGFDGYYDYNFNQPIGRVNQLRAYDVTSNSFNINQVSFVVEHLPTAQERVGGRVDLQFGQATETLQGSSANEQRPQVWRNLYQAYGSYLAPVGNGLQLDFGKFASSLGIEGNYTKDQIVYSRSYSYDFLPFYHMGLRANYNVTPKVNAAYWLVNGANDTEDLNGFKSQAFLLTLKPASTLSWSVNYYVGQEQRDVAPTVGTISPAGPMQPGLPTTNITPTPNGRNHIFDSYATWSATPKLTLVGEADYVLSRVYSNSQPSRVAIGAFYAKYALPRNWNLAGRFEYFDDRGGLFSGATQALKEFTFVGDHLVAPGFLVRAEYRRDFSNKLFFLTDQQGVLSRDQSTATLGLMYWWGTKQGSW